MSDEFREKLWLMKELLSLQAGKNLATAVAVAVVLASVILACRLGDLKIPGGLEFVFGPIAHASGPQQ